MSVELIIYGVIFVGVLLLVEGIYLTVFGKSIKLNSRVNRVWRCWIRQAGTGEETLEKLRKEMTQHLKARNIPVYSILSAKAQKAAIAFTPKQLIMLMVAVSVFAFVGLTFTTGTETLIRAAISRPSGSAVSLSGFPTRHRRA